MACLVTFVLIRRRRLAGESTVRSKKAVMTVAYAVHLSHLEELLKIKDHAGPTRFGTSAVPDTRRIALRLTGQAPALSRLWSTSAHPS